MNLSNLFRFAYWLDPAVTSQPAGPRIWVVIGAALVWAVAWLLLGRRSGRRLGRGVVMAQVLAGGITAAVGIGRWLLIPGLGWRVGWLLAGLVALAPLVWVWLRAARDAGWAQAAFAALVFAPNPSPMGKGEVAAHPDGAGRGVGRFVNIFVIAGWLTLHLLGMAVTTSVHRWPLWVGWGLIALMLLPALLRPRFTPRALMALTPLVLVYFSIGLRVITGFTNYLINAEYRVPEPFSTIFNPTLALLVAVGYGFVLSVRMALPDDRRFIKTGALAMIGLVVLWSLTTALSLRTYGVSGSDPYAYTQMGIDLATHGTVFHHFPLVRLTYDLNIPSEPVVHIGYRLPTDISRMSPTVWPPGYAVFTALAYLVGGETGIFVLAPLLGVVALVLIGGLVRLCLRDGGPARAAIIALTVFLTATSYQQIEWQLIPMADIASQVFSLSALALAIVGQHLKPSEGFKRSLRLSPAFAAGVCIGIAFGIRYTQVLIAPAVALALCLDSTEQRLRLTLNPSTLRQIMFAGLGAALAAAPTLAYHAIAFGSPLQTGSDELKHFVLALVPQTLQRLSAELFWSREFGLVWPFMLMGLVALWRSHRRALIILLTYALPVLIFHLLYSYVRQRDLLSIFPIFYCFAAVGMVDLVRWFLVRAVKPATRWAAFAIITLTCFLLMQRSVETIMLPITRGFGAFGYLVREQRQSFARLAELTPSNALIACSLNSGAVDLHAGRLSFRPAGWTADQLRRFVLALQHEGTPVYLLDDGKELAESFATLQAQFKLTEVGQIDVPYYFPNSGGSENRRVSLYRIER